MTLLAFLIPFLLFVAFPSRMWNFDGVACAAALELGNPVFFFHSNHLLYGFLGFLFWKPLSLVTLPRALPALQLFTSLLSAGGLVGIYLMLRGILKNARMALLLTLCMSVSAVLWVWSVEAQVYALAFLAISWATYELLKPSSPQKASRVGWLHAGAVLGHIIHVLWLIPALYWLAKEDPAQRQKNIQRYLTALSVGTVIPYFLVLGWMLLYRQTTQSWLVKWLLGSIALNPNSLFEWHLAGWTGPFLWAATTLQIFWGSFWPYHMHPGLGFWALTLLSALSLGTLLVASWKQHDRQPWTFAALWLGVYGLFFWTWEPTTECYRMTDAVPLAILLALGLMSLQNNVQRWGLLNILFVTLLPLNLMTRIIPMHDGQRNMLYQETIALNDATPNTSLYLTAGGTSWIYLLYFSGRSAWNLRSLLRNPQRLSAEIARHRRAGPVYIQREAFQLNGVPPLLSHYTLQPVDHLSWAQLQ